MMLKMPIPKEIRIYDRTIVPFSFVPSRPFFLSKVGRLSRYKFLFPPLSLSFFYYILQCSFSPFLFYYYTTHTHDFRVSGISRIHNLFFRFILITSALTLFSFIPSSFISLFYEFNISRKI